MLSNDTQQIANHARNFFHTLRDDGLLCLSYSD